MIPIGVPSDAYAVYQAGHELLNVARKYWDQYTLEQAKAQMQRADEAFKNPHLFQFLRWKYRDEPILERAGEVYPIAYFPASENQQKTPDSVLLSFTDTYPSDDQLSPKDATYRALREKVVPTLNTLNRLSFTMKDLKTNGQLGMKCELGRYFMALDTCDSLEWEILSKAHDLKSTDIDSFEKFDRQLTLRKELHAQVVYPVRDGSHRSAAIAMSTLIAYADEGSTFLLLKNRSATGVAVHPHLVHVIPAHMFQPATVILDKEFSVKHNFYREYLEECFGRPEPEDGAPDWRYFYGDPHLVELFDLLKTGRAEFYLSGIAVSLLNLRPEICTVLLIRDQDWWTRHSQHASKDERFRFCDEYAGITDFRVTADPKKMVGRIPLMDTDEKLKQVSSAIGPDNMVPPGGAAFWMGVDVLRRIL